MRLSKYIAFITLLATSGCDKKNDDVPDSTLELQINGASWTGKVATFHAERYSVRVTKYKNIDGVDVPKETYGFTFLTPKIGRQSIHLADINADPFTDTVTSSFSTIQQDGDVICDFYNVIDSDSVNNWINIEKEVNNFGEIWGTFNTHFIRIQSCSTSPYPDTMRLREGKFHLSFK